MNFANKPAWVKTAVDILNSMLLIEVVVRQDGNCHRSTVKSTLKASSKKFTVIIPMEEDQFGSRFGTCTCHAESQQRKESHVSTWRLLQNHQLLMTWLILLSYQAVDKAFWKEQYAQTAQCRTTAASMSDIKMNYTWWQSALYAWSLSAQTVLFKPTASHLPQAIVTSTT